MLPPVSATSVADAVALKGAPTTIDPLEPVAAPRFTVAAVSVSEVMMSPFAVRAKALPVEAPRVTEPVPTMDTLPDVFALKLAASV